MIRKPYTNLAVHLLLLIFSGLVTGARGAPTTALPPVHLDAEKLAREVTIYSDMYGVAHVFGRTDASTVFGFAYTQAEDNFGASGDPKNKHFMDQSPLYAKGEFKPAWTRLDEINANLERSYRPGEKR